MFTQHIDYFIRHCRGNFLIVTGTSTSPRYIVALKNSTVNLPDSAMRFRFSWSSANLKRKHSQRASKQKSHPLLSLLVIERFSGEKQKLKANERETKDGSTWHGKTRLINRWNRAGRNPWKCIRRGRNTCLLVRETRAARRNRREACVTPRETLRWRATTEREAF